MADTPRKEKERDVPFIVRAMCGCNVAMSESLAAEMTQEEKEQVTAAYKNRSGRQVLVKIRQRIASETNPKIDHPLDVIDLSDTDVVTDDEPSA